MLFVFLSHIDVLSFNCYRFDEVDEASPDKKPTIHEILLKGKREQRLPFEDQLRPPRGKFLTNCKTVDSVIIFLFVQTNFLNVNRSVC
jgi:hypothetical protein